ncbi:hypothetical protein PVAP13_3NG166994 [Panicum virgatum]|uniref:Uncharacterized protein n=1 Tax=Panicum virgatum TaxID=38727 RepID=A0A8T0U6K0_PANVG|nr:hypothetical protein PVAP13_3NG166994 [Panicum virgatum]
MRAPPPFVRPPGARAHGDPHVAQAEARDERGCVRAPVHVKEGSALDASTMGGSLRNAVARLMSLFVPGAGKAADTTGASSVRRRENSLRGAGAEEKRSV